MSLATEPAKIWREVIILWLVAIGTIWAFKLLSVIPFVRDNLWGIAGIIFLFLPMEFLHRRGVDPASFGITWKHLGKGLLWAGLFILISFPPYIWGFKWWFARESFHFALPSTFWQEVVGNVFLVALPEEAFYRGYMQTRLDKVFTGRVKILGAEVGWSVIVTAALFSLGHLVTFRFDRLGTFFPGIVFGWIRAKTGSIGGGVAFHASCNIWAQILKYGYFGI